MEAIKKKAMNQYVQNQYKNESKEVKSYCYCKVGIAILK